jgi:metal-responsive CopG/Arc/MetJ family transcriptional regulator
MKVAVSIPDEVFADAEIFARHVKASRSEIYSRALREFLCSHSPERVTEQMNNVVRDVGVEPDAFRAQAVRQIFKRTQW